jgi:hypothetical protein
LLASDAFQTAKQIVRIEDRETAGPFRQRR